MKQTYKQPLFFDSKVRCHFDLRGDKKQKVNTFFQQQLENLPQEILEQPRFFAVNPDKTPKTKGWSKPENQKSYTEIQGLTGFDTSGHGKGADYLFLDFDHVLDGNGNFVNNEAEKFFNRYQNVLKTYSETSASNTGAHMIAKPTEGKFKKISSGEKGRIYFDGEKKSFVEIFYKTGGRYCLFTGNLYHCEPNAPIAHGEAADAVFQELLDIIAARTKKAPKKAHKAKSKPETKQPLFDSPDYDSFRANIMLDAIDPADTANLPDTDWLAVISSAKNIGIPYSDVDAWCKRDPDRYNSEENLNRWNSINDPSFDIETLHGIAKRFGYSEKDTRREWYRLHPEAAPMDDDQRDNFFWTQDKVKSFYLRP